MEEIKIQIDVLKNEMQYITNKVYGFAVIRRFSNWFNRNFICSTIFSDGHIPEPHLTETFSTIHTKRCKRCKVKLGLGKWKHIPPPPNSTPEQIKIFEKNKKKLLSK